MRGLLPHSIIPEEVAERLEITVLKNVILCANCRKEILDWEHNNIRKVRYEEKGQQFTPLSAKELAKHYESVYIAFFAQKRHIRMVDTYSNNK